MATFAELFPACDIWLLQKFAQCHLTTEEALADRISIAEVSPHPQDVCFFLDDKVWWVDGGNVRHWFWCTGEPWSQRKRMRYKRGLLHGASEQWRDGGQRVWRAHYVNGKRDGLTETWYAETGRLQRRDRFVNGLQQGLSEAWEEDGRQWFRALYQDGIERWSTVF